MYARMHTHTFTLTSMIVHTQLVSVSRMRLACYFSKSCFEPTLPDLRRINPVLHFVQQMALCTTLCRAILRATLRDSTNSLTGGFSPQSLKLERVSTLTHSYLQSYRHYSFTTSCGMDYTMSKNCFLPMYSFIEPP